MSVISKLPQSNKISGGASLQNNLSATVPPTANDDSSAGYAVGSVWIDTVADEAYRCVDSTVGSAVWVKTTLSSDEFDILMASTTHNATEKTTPVDADEMAIVDSEDSNTLKKLTIGNLKSFFGKASNILVELLGTPTYDNLQDMHNLYRSAGRFTGGGLTDNGDGTLTTGAMTGLIRATNSETANLLPFDLAENTSVSLTDNSDNYVYVDYNGGTPQIAVATSMPTDHNTKILLGVVHREGTTLTFPTDMGQIITNAVQKMFFKDVNVNGKFQRYEGMKISEKTGRKIAVTAGKYYAGIGDNTTPALDTSGSDTMTEFYTDNGTYFTKVTGQTVIDNTHYDKDDGSGVLGDLADSSWLADAEYGVRWIYLNTSGVLAYRIGTTHGTLKEAQDAEPPTSTLREMTVLGGLIGKIIIQKNATTFTSIQSVFGQTFTPSGVFDHNNASNLQGGTAGNYWHLPKLNMSATTAPTTGDDSDDGYKVGSRWLDTTNNKEYICVDATVGSAVWKATTEDNVSTEASSATPTINTNNVNLHSITALAVAITSMTTNLSGSPVNGQKLIIRIKDNGTGRAITWGTSFEAKGVDLPTTTTASKVLTVGFIYDTVTSKWGCVASVEEA